MTRDEMLSLLDSCGLSCSTCGYYSESRLVLDGYEHVFGECTARLTTAGGHPSTDDDGFCKSWEPREDE